MQYDFESRNIYDISATRNNRIQTLLRYDISILDFFLNCYSEIYFKILAVTIEAEKTSAIGPLKFTRFLLTAENKNDSLPAGNFDLADEVLTQFSDKCPSAVTERTKVPKDEASVYWTSPPEGSGCILIR